MSLEQRIQEMIEEKLNDGTIEQMVIEKMEAGIVSALDQLFSSYGDVNKMIQEKVKSVMVPYLEGYDYSNYLTKLDDVLVDVLQHHALDNKRLLTNFKELMEDNIPSQMSITDLFQHYVVYVSENINTSNLEVILEDKAYYENATSTLEIEDVDRTFSSFETKRITFETEQDKDLTFNLEISRWKDSSTNSWDVKFDKNDTISSLRYANGFEMFLTKVTQKGVKITIDTDYIEDNDVEIKAEPEAYFE